MRFHQPGRGIRHTREIHPATSSASGGVRRDCASHPPKLRPSLAFCQKVYRMALHLLEPKPWSCIALSLSGPSTFGGPRHPGSRSFPFVQTGHYPLPCLFWLTYFTSAWCLCFLLCAPRHLLGFGPRSLGHPPVYQPRQPIWSLGHRPPS